MSFPPLDDFFDRLLSGSTYPTVRYQSSNPSPCTFGPIDSECNVRWRPLPRAKAQEESLPEGCQNLTQITQRTVWEAMQFSTSYWSAPLDCRFGYDRVVLDCGSWNEVDLERKRLAIKDTIDSLIHRPATIVIPLAWSTVNDGVCIGLNSESGKVVKTELACGEGDTLAATLEDFLRGLRPVKGYFRETVRSF